MAEFEREKELLKEREFEEEHYYDYEARFVKQKREQQRINILPRVIKPAMFGPGEFALGDVHIHGRYTVGPLSSLTCGFLALPPGGKSATRRMIPSSIAYIIEGEGDSIQQDRNYSFKAGDVVIIPSYTDYQFVVSRRGFRAWLPQVRLWHNQGLLWREQRDKDKSTIQARGDRKINDIFTARREVHAKTRGKTRYDWFLNRLAEENDIERNAPRVIRENDCPWEATRQGKLRFLISRWTEVASHSLDMVVQELDCGERSGEHRHIFEELLLVVRGRGHELHEGTRHPWETGDLICIPPMIAHQHVNDGAESAQLVSVWSRQPGHEFLGGIEQLSDAPDWRK